jgi:hypothetical protein
MVGWYYIYLSAAFFESGFPFLAKDMLTKNTVDSLRSMSSVFLGKSFMCLTVVVLVSSEAARAKYVVTIEAETDENITKAHPILIKFFVLS